MRLDENHRKKLALFILTTGMAVIVILHLRGQPVDVAFVYVTQAMRPNLCSLALAYHRDDDVVARAEYSFRRHVPPERKRHKLQLVRGTYMVEATLSYDTPAGDGRHAAGERCHSANKQTSRTLRRRVTVEGEDTFTITLR